MQCIARCKSNIFKQCSCKTINNKLCSKHLNEENLKTIETCLFSDKRSTKFY